MAITWDPNTGEAIFDDPADQFPSSTPTVTEPTPTVTEPTPTVTEPAPTPTPDSGDGSKYEPSGGYSDPKTGITYHPDDSGGFTADPTISYGQPVAPEVLEYASWAYVPGMGMVDVTIKDGQTFMADGSTLPVDSIVQTEGGLFQMTETGGQRTDMPTLQNLMQSELQGQMGEMQMQFQDIYTSAYQDYANQMGQFYQQYQQNMQGIIDQVMNIPAYESPYIQEIQNALQNVQQEFQYDPATDTALQQAQAQAQQSALNQLASRGIMGGSIAQERVAKVTSQLIPQYEQLAFQRYQQGIDNQFRMINTLSELDNKAYRTYQDQVDRAMVISDMMMGMADREYSMFKDILNANFESKIASYEAYLRQVEMKQMEIANAWDRVNELGYVDNQTSIILGVAPGTLSKGAREQIEEERSWYAKQAFLIEQDMAMEMQKHQNDIELIYIKDSLKPPTGAKKTPKLDTPAYQWYLTNIKNPLLSVATVDDFGEFISGAYDELNDAFATGQMTGTEYNSMMNEIAAIEADFIKQRRTIIEEGQEDIKFEEEFGAGAEIGEPITPVVEPETGGEEENWYDRFTNWNIGGF